MLHKLLSGLVLAFLLVLGLAACGPGGEPTAISEPAAVASPRPSATPTTGAVLATPLPASATPSPIPPSDTPPPAPPSATLAATPPPSATATSRPTLTPTTQAVQPVDPASIRVELESVVGGLDTPVGIAHAGDGSGRLFVLEKVGRIRVVQDRALLPTPFLDITGRVGSSQNEQGLLGLAFHPDYTANGLFFVNYTDRQGDTVVARFSVSADPGQAEPASEVVLLTLDQPAGNHNGGHLAFGPDGYLYIGTGDGGGAGDRYGNGQNGQTLLGAMLRLDVDGGEPYAIPQDNPFAGNPNVRDEIWAVGLRNPWRYSFDRLTGDLYIADVGQNVYEEVNFEPAGDPGGRNYGWPIMEGMHCFPADRPCDRTSLTLPVLEYDHTKGCSVTGGYVYRGQESPNLRGVYLFGDFCSGRIWGLAPTGAGDGDWQVAPLAQGDVRISAFGEDEAGELYLLDMASGQLFRIKARSR